MRKPVRALYILLICTVLHVVSIGASDRPQDTLVYDSDKLLNSVFNENIEYPPGVIDAQIENLLNFIPESQLVSTWTENIEMEDYMPSSSDSTDIHNYDTDQPMECTEISSCTEQTESLSYSTYHELDKEYPLPYYVPNESEQEYTESNALINYHQSTNSKRPEQAKKENISRKRQKKTEESSIDIDSIEDELNNSKIKKIKKCINAWNNFKLNNKHREGQYASYKPAVAFNKYKSNIYNNIGNKIHQSQIETYVRQCKTVYSKIPIQNEFWFIIASRTSRIYTKLADCQAINENPSEYKFIEGLSGYYPGLPGDIIRYMDKYEPIVSDQQSIKTEWKETLGDIYVRKPAELQYGIRKESISYETSNKYRSVAIAVQMIISLPEVHKDLSNLTAKFIEKTLEEEFDSNHLEVVRALHKIVAKHKNNPNQPEIDREYTVLCNTLRNILHQMDVSHESIVIQLYTEMYKSITYFYEKAEICEEILGSKKKLTNGEKEYYLLAGKCIIKPQRYFKCTTTIDLNKPVSGFKHAITEETNKWTIPSDIHYHYHIHYVDNTKQQYTRVCMPMYSNRHVHTISQIVEYLKRLYGIEKKECICPYKRNKSEYWTYIGEKERHKTVKDFTYCDIVFYYIEEGLRDDYFTFAEFESYIQPEDETVRIPLFLSPLMQSAVSMGPFKEADKTKHAVISNIQSMWMHPSVYTYKEKYKAIEYSHLYHYYSNLYIRRGNANVPTIDCYIMDSKVIISNCIITVEWYVKIPNSVDEYTYCILSDNLINDQGKYDKFGKAVKTQEYTPDSVLYGFELQSSLEMRNGLDGISCTTDYPMDPNDTANYELNTIPIHKTSIDPKIANLQSKVDQFDKNIEQVEIMIKEPGTTEEQKNEPRAKTQNIYLMKFRGRHKLLQIQSEDQPLIEEELNTTPLPLCSFLVFRHSNTRTKSSLGAHNEILEALAYRYNAY